MAYYLRATLFLIAVCAFAFFVGMGIRRASCPPPMDADSGVTAPASAPYLCHTDMECAEQHAHSLSL